MSDILGPVDNAFLHVESERSPMNIGAVLTFDGKIDFSAFKALIDSRLHQAPIYQKRLVQDPLKFGPLKWMYDPDFHIGNHVFEHTLPAPGDDDKLRRLAGKLVSGMLDRSKPLWECHLIHGLSEGRTGVFFKVHHCMVDGLAAVEIFSLMLDFMPETPPPSPKPLYDPPYLPNKTDMVVEGLREDLPHKLRVVDKIRADLGQLGEMLADKERRRKAFVGLANLFNDNLSLIRKLPINGVNTGKQALAWAEFSLAEVRAIKSNRGASVNDVMLTVLTAALDRYFTEIQASREQPFLRILVPVSMRLESEKQHFGNRISVLPIDVPFKAQDPLERLEATTRYTGVMKASSLSIGLDVVLSIPSLAPTPMQPLIWKIAPAAFSVLAHTWCTNVAGPQIPLYLLGQQMLRSYGFFPINPSMGLACVVTSYNHLISMTLVVDEGIVPDVAQIRDKLYEAFEELRTAAKVPEMTPPRLERASAVVAKAAEPASVVEAAPDEQGASRDQNGAS